MPKDSPSDVLQGTLDLLVLKTLALEPMHGWGCSSCALLSMYRVFRAISVRCLWKCRHVWLHAQRPRTKMLAQRHLTGRR